MDLLKKTVEAIAPHDQESRAAAHARLEQLTMPHWALGQLMDIAEDLAGMTRSVNPPLQRKVIVTMAGDHGVVAEGVSLFPQEVTLQMIHNFVAGGAGINALARNVGAHVVVVDMGTCSPLPELVENGKLIDKRIGNGTANLTAGPAMNREQAIASLQAGIEVAAMLAPSTDVFGTGEMGIGNTTPSAAIASCLTGLSPEAVTGRGTGIDEERWRNKVDVIERALTTNQPDASDGLDVLAKVGGFEIGGIAGLCLGAARYRKPIVVDGFISTAGALIAHSLCPTAAEYMICAHRSVEVGHTAMLERLGKTALLDLQFRLGEGTGAAVAMHLLDAAKRVLTEVATFAEAAVSAAEKK